RHTMRRMLGQPPETRPIEPAWTRRSLGWRQVRELALWVVVVAGVLNFTPTLLSGEPVNETALWTKAAKDIPLLLLLAVVAAEARSRVLPTRRPARTLALAACAMG